MPTNFTRGQISFIDLHDGKSMTFVIMAQGETNQLCNLDKELSSPERYVPDYTVTANNLVLTPYLSVSGVQNNALNNDPTWLIDGKYLEGASADPKLAALVSAGKIVVDHVGYTLTIKTNDIFDGTLGVGKQSFTISCVATYTDLVTNLDTEAHAQIQMTQMHVRDGGLMARVYSDGPSIFHNDALKEQIVTLKCILYRGSEPDTTNVAFQWYRKDRPGAETADWYKLVASYSGPGGTPDTGTFSDGQTWEEVLDDTYNTGTGIIGGRTNTIQIHVDDILNYDAFMCQCTDTDPSNTQGTYGKYVLSDTETVYDHTDTITIDFVSNNGTTFTNNTNSLTSTAVIWQDGQAWSAAKMGSSSIHYLWQKRKHDGTLATGDTTDPEDYKHANGAGTPDANWSSQVIPGSSTASYCRYAAGNASLARELTVFHGEIEGKATFTLEVYMD